MYSYDRICAAAWHSLAWATDLQHCRVKELGQMIRQARETLKQELADALRNSREGSKTRKIRRDFLRGLRALA